MILFIAPNPHKAKDKEGFLQRVEAIDALYNNKDKVYFDDISKPEEKAQALIDAGVIYVHSAYNANKILNVYQKFGNKIITDLHGVVPEEEKYLDNIESYRVMSHTEAVAFKYGRVFVSVSDEMRSHFEAKYPASKKCRWVTLPIHNTSSKVLPHRPQETHLSVIYAGGSQSWQNTDMMTDTINKLGNIYKFTILTHDKDAFADINENALNNTIIKSVSSSEVGSYYSSSLLGFILRKENLVNRVACPTKLIEYIQHGVVPIVLSEDIGDFKKMGYKFVKIKELIEEEVDLATIYRYREDNFKVYEKFKLKIAVSQKNLLRITDKIINQSHGSTVPLETIEVLQSYNQTVNDLIRKNYQIEVYKRKVTEYAELAEHYRLEYERGVSNKSVKGLLKQAMRRTRH